MEPGQAVKIQMRKEGIQEIHTLKAKFRANPKITQKEVQLDTFSLGHLPTKHPQRTLAVEGPQRPPHLTAIPSTPLEKRRLRSQSGEVIFPWSQSSP